MSQPENTTNASIASGNVRVPVKDSPLTFFTGSNNSPSLQRSMQGDSSRTSSSLPPASLLFGAPPPVSHKDANASNLSSPGEWSWSEAAAPNSQQIASGPIPFPSPLASAMVPSQNPTVHRSIVAASSQPPLLPTTAPLSAPTVGPPIGSWTIPIPVQSSTTNARKNSMNNSRSSLFPTSAPTIPNSAAPIIPSNANVIPANTNTSSAQSSTFPIPPIPVSQIKAAADPPTVRPVTSSGIPPAAPIHSRSLSSGSAQSRAGPDTASSTPANVNVRVQRLVLPTFSHAVAPHIKTLATDDRMTGSILKSKSMNSVNEGGSVLGASLPVPLDKATDSSLVSGPLFKSGSHLHIQNSLLGLNSPCPAKLSSAVGFDFLSVPQSFGNVHLGEMLSCLIVISQDIPMNVQMQRPLHQVHVQVELQTASGNKHVLLDTNATNLQGFSLPCGGQLEFLVKHNVKELGVHMLSCQCRFIDPNVSISSDIGTQRNLRPNHAAPIVVRKLYKFQVLHPLSVKTKVHTTTKNSVFLEVQLQTVLAGGDDALLEDAHIVPQETWLSDAGKVEVPFNEPWKKLIICPGSARATRHYLYHLEPASAAALAALIAPVNSNVPTGLGKLDLAWRTVAGENGRLQTSTLVRKPSTPGSVSHLTARLIATRPTRVSLNQIFVAEIIVANRSGGALSFILQRHLSENSVEISKGTCGIVSVGKTDMALTLPSGESRICLEFVPLYLGLQSLPLLKLTNATSNESTTIWTIPINPGSIVVEQDN